MSGVPPLGLPKIKSFVGGHLHPHLGRFSAVVDECEQNNVLGLQDGLEPVHRFVDRVVAGDGDDAAVLHDNILRVCGGRPQHQAHEQRGNRQIFHGT